MSFPSAEGMARACAADVGYVLVARDWAGFSEAGLDQVRSADPNTVVFDNPEAVVLRARGTPGCASNSEALPVP